MFSIGALFIMYMYDMMYFSALSFTFSVSMLLDLLYCLVQCSFIIVRLFCIHILL